jgi:hypothetical protein
MPCTNAVQTVQCFFNAYRAHDIDQMVDLCDDMAAYRSVSFEVRRRQRVIRGDGKVRTIGKIVWAGLIDAFPDQTNEVINIISDNKGNVAAEVMIGGKQAKPWGDIESRGRSFWTPHLFIFHLNHCGKIDSIRSYSDNAAARVLLGSSEID